MPNPAGQNQLDRFGTQQYGAVKRLTELTKEAPMSGAPMAQPNVNAPRRSQRQAVGPTKKRNLQGSAAPSPLEQVAQPMNVVMPPASGGPHSAYIAQVWADIASVPGASPMIQQLAQRAQAMIGRDG